MQSLWLLMRKALNAEFSFFAKEQKCSLGRIF